MLSVDQKIELSQLEVKIENGLRSFREAGQALMLIRDQQLYAQSTFETYCHERWSIGRAHAYRLIDAFKVVEDLSPTGDIPLPQSERQTRPLAKLPSEQRQPAWEAAVAVSEQATPTYVEVEAAVVAVQAPEGVWQPQQKTTVIGTGEAVTVVSVDPKKPLVVCQDSAGVERTFLTTQLSGHAEPTPVVINRAASSKASAPNYREQAEISLQVESERLALVEAAAKDLAISTHELIFTPTSPSECLVKKVKKALKNMTQLLGLNLSQ